ncbi:hypothetical protein JYQ62_19980 [Nostoc sp. UHCC 0702]|nr:hypothetical protein JYQ62_19980 [Nostoc sp. UHCC 0702]
MELRFCKSSELGNGDWGLGTGDWRHFDKLSASLGNGDWGFKPHPAL